MRKQQDQGQGQVQRRSPPCSTDAESGNSQTSEPQDSAGTTQRRALQQGQGDGGPGDRPPSLILGLLPEEAPLLSQPHLPLQPQPRGLDNFGPLPPCRDHQAASYDLGLSLDSPPHRAPPGLILPRSATDPSTHLPPPSPWAAKHQRKQRPCKASHHTFGAQARGAPNPARPRFLSSHSRLAVPCPLIRGHLPHLQVQRLPSAQDFVPVATSALSSPVRH